MRRSMLPSPPFCWSCFCICGFLLLSITMDFPRLTSFGKYFLVLSNTSASSNRIQWFSSFSACSATAGCSEFPNLQCRLCSPILVLTDRLVVPMYVHWAPGVASGSILSLTEPRPCWIFVFSSPSSEVCQCGQSPCECMAGRENLTNWILFVAVFSLVSFWADGSLFFLTEVSVGTKGVLKVF